MTTASGKGDTAELFSSIKLLIPIINGDYFGSRHCHILIQLGARAPACAIVGANYRFSLCTFPFFSICSFIFFYYLCILYLYAMEKIKTFFNWLRSCISPVYIVMLIAAFILWFSTKLGHTYTTDHDVTVIIDGESYDVNCKIKGKGTALIYYTISSKRSCFTIPLSDLTIDPTSGHVTAESMKQALIQRMSNIEVEAVGSVPIIKGVVVAGEEHKNDE